MLRTSFLTHVSDTRLNSKVSPQNKNHHIRFPKTDGRRMNSNLIKSGMVVTTANIAATPSNKIVSQEDIANATLERLTGLRFRASQIHIKGKTPVSRPPNRRERRAILREVNVVNWVAGIDKADGMLFEPVEIDQLKAHVERLGFKWRHEMLGDDQDIPALRISGNNGECLHVVLRHIKSQRSRKVSTNPNRFSSAVNYYRFLVNVFGLNHVEYLKLKRLDLNVDIEEDFEDVWRMVRVKFKQKGKAMTSKSGNTTGLYFGGKNFVICVYDKTAQMKSKAKDLGKPVTRVEIRLKGKALPFEYIYDLPKLIKPTIYGNRMPQFFSTVFIQPFKLADKKLITNLVSRDRLVDLTARIDSVGLDAAIKKLNKHSNFARDHRGLIVYEDYPHDLNTILLSRLHKFFGKRMLEL